MRTTPPPIVIRLNSKAVAYSPVRCCGGIPAGVEVLLTMPRTSCAAWTAKTTTKVPAPAAASSSTKGYSASCSRYNGQLEAGVRVRCSPSQLNRQPTNRQGFMMRTPNRSRGWGAPEAVSVRSTRQARQRCPVRMWRCTACVRRGSEVAARHGPQRWCR